MIRTFKSKTLGDLWETSSSGIDAKLHPRTLRRLDALDAAIMPSDVALPGFDYHALRGTTPKRYAVLVNGPWRITFEFEKGEAHALDFEQQD